MSFDEQAGVGRRSSGKRLRNRQEVRLWIRVSLQNREGVPLPMLDAIEVYLVPPTCRERETPLPATLPGNPPTARALGILAISISARGNHDDVGCFPTSPGNQSSQRRSLALYGRACSSRSTGCRDRKRASSSLEALDGEAAVMLRTSGIRS